MRWLPPLLITVCCATAPALTTDDVHFFNYLNNATNRHALYYHNGYVPVLPELAAFIVTGLPLVWQGVSYRAVPLLAMLLLYGQLRRLLASHGHANARLIALAVTIAIISIDRDIGANLAYTSWAAFLVATIYIARRVDRRRYPWLASAGVFLAGVSLPAGMFLALGIFARAQSDGATRRWQDLVLAAAILVAHAWVLVDTPNTYIGVVQPSLIGWTFVEGFAEHVVPNSIALASSAIIIATGVLVWRRGQRMSFAAGVLSGVGLMLVGGYPISDRFLDNGGFENTYVTGPLMCATAVVFVSLGRTPARVRRWWSAVTVGAAVMALVIVISSEGADLQTDTLLKYRFLREASTFRSSCHAGEAILYDHSDAAPLLLCTARRFEPGVVELPDAVVWDPESEPRGDEIPAIVIPQALFR